MQPIRTVLVATDLQATSRSVVEAAGTIARAADALLVLLHVLEPRARRPFGDAVGRDLQKRLEGDARNALEHQAKELEEAGTRVQTAQVEDRAAHDAILERVRAASADLVVVGSHAREGRGHRLGSTADRLLRTSPAPCLVVRGSVDLPARRIAAATDFSRGARRAARLAASWCGALAEPGARLDVVHVGDEVFRGADGAVDELVQGWLDREHEQVRGECSSSGLTVGARLVWDGHPVDGLVRIAEEEGYDLIVVATHGQGRIRRALVGSVALGLAQSAPCPVLVVPPRPRR